MIFGHELVTSSGLAYLQYQYRPKGPRTRQALEPLLLSGEAG